jgi:hypothetical protein
MLNVPLGLLTVHDSSFDANADPFIGVYRLYVGFHHRLGHQPQRQSRGSEITIKALRPRSTLQHTMSSRLHEYQVIGRKLPTETDAVPNLYRMRIFAPNEQVAKSRFWYFLKQARKVKKASGEIVSVNEVCCLQELV